MRTMPLLTLPALLATRAIASPVALEPNLVRRFSDLTSRQVFPPIEGAIVITEMLVEVKGTGDPYEQTTAFNFQQDSAGYGGCTITFSEADIGAAPHMECNADGYSATLIQDYKLRAAEIGPDGGEVQPEGTQNDFGIYIISSADQLHTLKINDQFEDERFDCDATTAPFTCSLFPGEMIKV